MPPQASILCAHECLQRRQVGDNTVGLIIKFRTRSSLQRYHDTVCDLIVPFTVQRTPATWIPRRLTIFISPGKRSRTTTLLSDAAYSPIGCVKAQQSAVRVSRMPDDCVFAIRSESSKVLIIGSYGRRRPAVGPFKSGRAVALGVGIKPWRSDGGLGRRVGVVA